MLPVVKIIDEETGTGKASEIFRAQWYPKVVAYVKQTGSGLALSVKLQGSINGTDWVDIGSAITANGILTNFVAAYGDIWYPLYRIYITTNTGTLPVLNAWIGAGGA